jgi:hypothetical protein
MLLEYYRVRVIDEVSRLARPSAKVAILMQRLETSKLGLMVPWRSLKRSEGPTVECRYACVGSPDRRAGKICSYHVVALN